MNYYKFYIGFTMFIFLVTSCVNKNCIESKIQMGYELIDVLKDNNSYAAQKMHRHGLLNKSMEDLEWEVNSASRLINKYGGPDRGLVKVEYVNHGSPKSSLVIITYPIHKARNPEDSIQNALIKVYFNEDSNNFIFFDVEQQIKSEPIKP